VGDLIAGAVKTPAAQQLRERVEAGGVLSLEGVSLAAYPYLAAWVHWLVPERPLVAVVDLLKTQESVHQDLCTWLTGVTPTGRSTATRCAEPLFYPAWDVWPHESRLPHADVISERLETLLALGGMDAAESRSGAAPVVVTTAVALQQRTFSPSALKKRTRLLRAGDHCDPLELVAWLESQAYEPEAQVTQKGELALRGGILDIFPLSSRWPVRLEFFGNQLESLRLFDPLTQLSREATDGVVLPPAGELALLRRLAAERPGELGSLVDYLDGRAVVLLFDLPELVMQARRYAEGARTVAPLFVEWENALSSMRAQGATLVDVAELPGPGLNEPGHGDEQASSPPVDNAAQTGGALVMRLPSLEAFRSLDHARVDSLVAETQRRAFFEQLHRWLRQGMAVHLFCNNEGERQRFHEVWTELGLPAVPVAVSSAPTGEVTDPGMPRPAALLKTHLGTLSRGFICEEGRWVVVTDAEVFGRYRILRPRRLRSAHAQTTRSALEIDFGELDDGDYVVHLRHGIGRYLGLQTMPVRRHRPDESHGEGASGCPLGEECLVIEYAASVPDQPAPKLYVPVSQSHLVSKYVGAGKARPPLNALGGSRWAKTKAQAEQAVQDLASDLLGIQAARDTLAGFAHATDTPWQREFEAAFLYEETPDQQRAIEDSKRDMELPRPMDRLVCGDVGFGKTEVAIRSAFKAVMGGKQVALLVPTTILAQQHFQTFRERMADYPVRIELLSRFRTRRQQQQVVRDLASGAVDIVIGTHRLVQPDIQFKELGLVIVDEEQRFGVLQKERFKQLRQLVDVLTLSATPIPRTLHLALTGARDMSTIETPPQDRLPVETIVAPFDERVIREAIRRELGRGGQVFYLHNRVTTIHEVGRRLQELVPEARLVIGHGQMPADELEEVMTRFVAGQADLLLSTTIIESGIDIPNANTIIIDRADRFGLSDLYQLRGRVGRYKHQAYAYFLLPRHAALLADARKRMSAIRQYSSLGSGFKIAMRDLEIRGAGNLLGAEQSGHITAVGFELYCQLLQQSIARLKGERPAPRVEVVMRLDFLDLNAAAGAQELAPGSPGVQTAGLPVTYIPEARHRIEIFRKLAQVTEETALARLKNELRDRFGPPPPAVQRLLDVGALRLLAARRQVTSLETRGDQLRLMRNGDFIMVGGKFPRLTRRDVRGRLSEIRRLLSALDPGEASTGRRRPNAGTFTSE
jgi:transcription-repair coupling factor (superfamily II helicase)